MADSDASAAANSGPCGSCGQAGAKKRCAGCRKVFYCSREHQVKHWKAGHKQQCAYKGKAKKKDTAAVDTASAVEQSRQLDPQKHKEEFNAVIKKYNLAVDGKADRLTDYIMFHHSRNQKIDIKTFAEKFNMSVIDSITFLSWIERGLQFKEQVMDPNNSMAAQMSQSFSR